MFVKICGITRPEDALVAQAAGAAAIGMIFVRGSKREVDIDRAAPIASAVGPFTTKVGVFRDAPVDAVREAVARLRLDAVQLHGSENAAYVAALRDEVLVVKALAFTPDLGLAEVAGYGADAVLLDGMTAGSGEPFDWKAARRFAAYPRLILAGGLDPGNVGRAVAELRPYAVDVASGVERAPGRKDEAKIRAFIAAATSAGRSAPVHDARPGSE